MKSEYLRGVLTNNIDRCNDIIWDLQNKDEFNKQDPNVLGVIAVAEQILVSLTALLVDCDASSIDTEELIERCAVAAEQQDRAGHEWVSDSLWANILRRAGTSVRSLKIPALPPHDGGAT